MSLRGYRYSAGYRELVAGWALLTGDWNGGATGMTRSLEKRVVGDVAVSEEGRSSLESM